MDPIQSAAIFLSISAAELGLGLGGIVAGTAVSLGMAGWVLVRMPEDYLDTPEIRPLSPDRPQWVQISARIGKNILGIAVAATGVVLAMPGIVGPGVPLILVGLVLTDIPGKRRLERRILCTPKVLATVNLLRAHFNRPPLRIAPSKMKPA